MWRLVGHSVFLPYRVDSSGSLEASRSWRGGCTQDGPPGGYLRYSNEVFVERYRTSKVVAIMDETNRRPTVSRDVTSQMKLQFKRRITTREAPQGGENLALLSVL